MGKQIRILLLAAALCSLTVVCSGRVLRDVVTEDPKVDNSDLVMKLRTLKTIQEKMENARRLLAEEDVPEEIEVEYPPDFNDDGNVLYEEFDSDGESILSRSAAFEDDEEEFEIEVEDEATALPNRRLLAEDDEEVEVEGDLDEDEDIISPEDEVEVVDEDADPTVTFSDFVDEGEEVDILPEDEVEVMGEPED